MFGFHVTKSMMLSFATLATVLGLFTAASTFAAFTAEDTETGFVKAGYVTINAQGDLGAVATDGLSFLLGGVTDCTIGMAPGDTCSETVHVTNNGTLPVTVSAPLPVVTNFEQFNTGVLLPDCTVGDWPVTGTLASTVVNPGDSTSYVITVQLHPAASNGCQAEAPTISVTVSATT
jgi:hypothetical protein